MESKTKVVKERLEISRILKNALSMAIKYAPVLIILVIVSYIIDIIFPEIDRVVYQKYLQNYGFAGKLVSTIIKSLITGITSVIGSAIAYTFVHKTEIEKKEYMPSLLHSLSIIASKKFFLYVLYSIKYYVTIFIGALCFIAPGIIRAVKYLFAPMIVLLEPEGVDASKPFEESARITDGYKADVFMVIFYLFIISSLIAGLGTQIGALVHLPLRSFGALVLPVYITANVIMMYILIDKKKVIVETSGTDTQTYKVKAGNSSNNYMGIIVLAIFVILGIRIADMYIIHPHGSIELSDHVSLTTDSIWQVKEDRFIPGNYTIEIPNMAGARQLVVRSSSKISLNIAETEINDTVRAVLDSYCLNLKKTAKLGFSAADTPYQRSEIDVNGKKWAVCEYRKQQKERTHVWKVYYTLMGESIPQVYYEYLSFRNTSTLQVEATIKKDEEIVKNVLGNFLEKTN